MARKSDSAPKSTGTRRAATLTIRAPSTRDVLAQRDAELGLINAIQRGLAARLDFQAIVDIVGDKLRDLFATQELAITWYEEGTDLVHYLYCYEHGERLSAPPRPPTAGGVYDVMQKTLAPCILNVRRDYERFKLSAMPGTDQSQSTIVVPIVSGNRFL
ncbi:MAG TPA: hypothetical protein VKU81_09470, partial [Casimicrobiaceae bacterium]|nr:hypothetical protein [Casimicrobiaceae bacterium]